jgi:hypothetical protein
MKKILIAFPIFILLICACSNEFKLVAPAKEIPIVYGFLSRSDTAQYLRIEKAFIDPEKSALTLAQDPNALYFEDIKATIQDVATAKTYVLQRVDGNLEGYKRATGIFATTPNYLYKINTTQIDLKENASYKLIIKRKDGSVLSEAITQITPDIKLNEGLTQPNNFSVAGNFKISWNQSSYQTAKLYDIIMHINVEERDPTSSTWTPNRLSWAIIKNFVPGTTEIVLASNNINYTYKENSGFYAFISNNLDKNKPVLRRLKDIDVEIISGGKDLYEYINIGSINSGITGTEVLPTYSNVKDGYGILSSRNRLYYKGINLNGVSIDSLKNGRFTKAFKFQ